jgi:ribosomal protein S18 acetylase RimI-like enzyme
VAIVTKQWFLDLLQNSGFTRAENLVLLEWTARLVEPVPVPRGVHIRPMLVDDLAAVAETDSSAFDPLWRNSILMLQKAFSQAFSASVAEQAGRIVGYQISTGNMLGVHLARLGVRKEAQGLGIGSALVSDLLLCMSANHVPRLTVNTQADNAASLSLYEKVGFVRTGEQYPVLVYQV